MPSTEHRIAKLRRRLRDAAADSALITNFTNVTYLTGFTGDDSYLLVTREGQVLITDMRYTEQLKEECPGLDLDVRGPGTKMLDAVNKVIRSARVMNLAIEAGSMTVGMYEQLTKKLEKISFVSAMSLVEELRLIKDRDEIDRIRVAVGHAEKAFRVVRASLRPELTEQEVAHALEHQIRLFGGQKSSFPPIVAVGPRAALPHAVPTQQRIGESDFVLIDWGACSQHYCSDLTRVLVTGRISPKLERIYEVVKKAQLKAMAAIKPGAIMEDVDSAARKVIADAGFGRQFGHGLGHGIGLEIHEAPRLAMDQKQPLKAGMVVTVEPGIYLSRWGGVRIEDDVLVTKTGHEVLTSIEKELADCVVG